jgi:delta-aminolevulinic acid dehydratase/porphobilinogen synthase
VARRRTARHLRLSGERRISMIVAAANNGWIGGDKAMMEA